MTSPEEILKKYWGYDSFRPLQKDIIQAVLEKRDVLVLLPTGAGKSLCYQVPALMLDGFCLVISPLIALMQDQVQRLKAAGIDAACIHAGMHYNDVKRVLENMLHGPYKLLYVSPERLQTELFREFLPAFDISFIAVDEAHCISQWGHDFRPDYLKISGLADITGKLPMLALTATATTEVQKDISQQLQLLKPALFHQSFERSNIFYEAKYSENKNNDVLDCLRQNGGSSIVYCRSRKQTETLAKYLQQQGIKAVFYHAGMAKERREQARTEWMQDEAPVMVATTAFGMGIDKNDVRSVVHYDVPEHLEAYYQESGRAGRDNKPSISLLLFNNMNISNLRENILVRFPPEDYLRKVYQAVVEYLQVPIGTEPDRYFDFELADLCKKFNLEATPASYALKLLEQEGLWTLSDAVFKPATIQFTCLRQELDDISATYPGMAVVITALLRLYGTIFYHPTTVRLPVIARQLKKTKEETEAFIYQLQAMGVLEYNTPKDGPQLFFHHYRVDSRHLLINTKRIATLKKQHITRMEAMVAYLQQHECRNKTLLRYFGEDAAGYCGHCDVCRQKALKSPPKDQLRKEVQHIIGQNQPLGLQQLSSAFSPAIRAELTTLVRELIDEGRIQLHENGSLSLVK